MPVSEKPSEKHCQTQVVQLARLSGFLIYHTFDSRRSAAGFPDLVLVRPPHLIFAELESEGGLPRPEQSEWLEALRGCETVRARLLRSPDWPEMVKTLSKRGG